MNKVSPELLPCPLCCGDELSHGYSRPGVDGSEETGEVQCHSCDLLLWKPTEAEAITAWNTRHRIDGQEEMRRAVVRECAEVANRAYRSYSEPTDWDCGAQDACTKIEREILAALHTPEEKDNGSLGERL